MNCNGFAKMDTESASRQSGDA